MTDNKKLIHPKGYQLHVTSWENDGDNYRTKTLNVPTLQEAMAYKHICETLFQSGAGIGNLCEGEEEEAREKIAQYARENPILFKDEDIYDFALDIAWETMGSSEFYLCRVCESAEITYSEGEVWVQTIK